MEIGSKIKELRLMSGLTQEEVADRCELTKGYISQLENDLTSPSISTLKDILSALGSTLTEFFSADEEEAITFSENDYIEKDMGGSILKWLVPTSQKNAMEPVIMSLSPGAATFKDLPHEGEEFGYVLSGDLMLIVGKRKERLKSGMSFYFRSGKAHYLENKGKEEASVLWITCPPNF